MRFGFEVTLRADGTARFNMFSTKQFSENSLLTFAEDPLTGTAVALVGRLYYQNELKDRLALNNRQNFLSNANLVLTIFQRYGQKSLVWLEGEFALVVFDPEKQQLLAMRDPLGSWPLYWSYNDHMMRVRALW